MEPAAPSANSPLRVEALYRVRCDARSIAARAEAIAVEQSVEMPVAAIANEAIRAEILGRVADIRDVGNGCFDVSIALAAATIGGDAGQLFNMLFGNTSLHEDVTLEDVAIPAELAKKFPGPGHGLPGLRRRAGAGRRALTCSALKPQGLSSQELAQLAARFAAGGIDFIKDDHGLADQAYSPFAERVPRIAAALREVGASKGRVARYVPSLSGDLDDMRRQIACAAACGIDTVMIAPMIAGPSTLCKIVRENPGLAFFAHPSLAGAARIAPALLYGKLFRLLGADAVIFPNHGGRFGYSPQICRDIARTVLREWHGLKPAAPTPAGGMSRARVPEMLDFYRADVMLLIGGALLEAGDRLTQATADFVGEVARHGDG